MNAETHRRAIEVFEALCDLPAHAQAAALEEHRGDDGLREMVERMLAEDAAGDDGSLAIGGAAELIQSDPGSGSPIPDRLGRYRIVRELGRGGMGVVYEAEQEDPTRRVALKVLRTGFVSGSLVSRFRREAQALAQLQHRGIAHIYESGSARVGNDDVPFFAMEYIGGRPLDKHAEANALSARQKLELVARVCDAVQHAHQKGVIHRDLKPSNVLVVEESTGTGQADDTGTVIDAIGQPKILDFGIARFTDADVHATVQTSTGQIVGTLAYMSPEQVDGRPEELDTRCDVYALGVMLYALLAGRTPHDLGGMPVAEAARTIKEDEPPSLGALDGALRGDIATIAAKAIDKDRDRRYASAGLMAEDIRRYLRDEPIAARPASTLYQLRKFARRNKALVGGVAASFALLVLGVVGTSLGLAWALRANADLKQANTELSNANDEIESIVEFQDGLFSGVSLPRMGETIRAGLLKDLPPERREELERLFDKADFTNAARHTLGETFYWPAIDQINTTADDQSLVRARLTRVFADRLFGLGFHCEAASLIVEALELCRDELGSVHPETLLCESMAASYLVICGDHETAIRLATRNLNGARALDPPDHDRLEAALRTLGRIHFDLGNPSEGRTYHEEALRLWRETGAGGNANAAFNMTRIAEGLAIEGHVEAAEARFREAFSFTRKTIGREDYTTLLTASQFGTFLCQHGQRGEGIELMRSTLESLRRVRGDDDLTTMGLRHSLASILIETSEFTDAEALALEQARIVRERYGAGSDALSGTAALLTSLYEAWHEAEPNEGYNTEAARWRTGAASRGAGD